MKSRQSFPGTFESKLKSLLCLVLALGTWMSYLNFLIYRLGMMVMMMMMIKIILLKRC